MKSVQRGKSTSDSEVTNISKHGFWMLVSAKEIFLSFENFPWFRDVSVSRLLNVKLLHAQHLYWPDLDLDLSVDSILHPKKFPLVSKVGVVPRIRAKRKIGRVKRAKKAVAVSA